MPALWVLILGPSGNRPRRGLAQWHRRYCGPVTVLMGLASQMRLARLQLVTDIRTRQGDWPDFVRAVFDAGVDILQVRDADADPAHLLEALEVAHAIAFDHRKLVAVAGNPAVAARFGADVLHLGATDRPLGADRGGLPAASLLGRSVHSAAQLDAALADPGLSYLFVGPVFGQQDADGQGNGGQDAPGLGLVREAARRAVPSDRAARPWFAVGGIGPDTLDRVLDAGARRIAVGTSVTQARDAGSVVQQLSHRLHQAWDADPALQSYRLHGFGTPPVASFRD